jgi:hypothetical protein
MTIIKKNPKVVLILTAVSFFASGIDCLENNLLIIAVLSFVVAFINIIASFFLQKHAFYIKIVLLFVNATFAALSSYFYYVAGRDKIQYGWAVVSIIYFISIGVAFRKRMKSKKTDDERLN